MTNNLEPNAIHKFFSKYFFIMLFSITPIGFILTIIIDLITLHQLPTQNELVWRTLSTFLLGLALAVYIGIQEII